MKFDRTDFRIHNGYLTYQGKFVARFRHAASVNAKGFVRFLIQNFSVEEYFAALKTEAPLTVLEAKGFVQPHILTWLKTGKLAEWKGHDFTYWQVRQ